MKTNVSITPILSLIIITIFNACAPEKEPPQPPNVILIMADDMGYESLGCYGSAEYQTPVLDKMAAEGAKFNHCYSQPLCTPSRVKIMTGKHNFRNYKSFGYLPVEEKTFGNIFQDAGYKTLVAGKWQLNGLNRGEPDNQDQQRPYEFGFDEYCLWQLTKRRSEGERFANPLLEQNGKVLDNLQGQYGPDIFRDYILDFIERNQDSSFFVYFPMVLVHEPFVPTPDSEEWSNPEARYKKDTSFYADMMTYTDKIVGQIKDKVEELDLLENTLIIFTADNGTHPSIYSTMQDGLVIQGAKGETIEYGHRVPMIAYWKNHIETQEIDHLIEFNDILPTIVDATGIIMGEFKTDGRTFMPALLNQNYQPREHVYIYYEPKWGRWEKGEYVFNKEYKLYTDGRFFHIAEDKLEKNPIAFDECTEQQQAVWSAFEEVLKEKQGEKEVAM